MNPVTSQAIGCRQTLANGASYAVLGGGTETGCIARGSQTTATTRVRPPQIASESRQSAASAIGTATSDAIAAPPVMNAV
jgi:hypothetical protein